MTAASATASNDSKNLAAENLPRAFGRYLLFDMIGRGGMADIYLARMGNSLGGHRLCVIKEIRDTFDHDPAFMEMLTAEAKLAGRLNHANIVQVFDLGREGGRLFLAMDYVEGFDLHQLLRRLSKGRIPLPAEFAFSIVIETLRALDYAHRARDDQGAPLGIVHRDVSPSNVLISFEGEVKLCDFGIARATTESADEETIAATRVAGKAAYMAPEHAHGSELDARADIFAAGILLWELCAGRRLYKGKGREVLELAKAADIPALPERGIPSQAALQKILNKALSADRDERYKTAAEFLEVLEDFALDEGLRASPLRFGSFLSDHFADEIVGVRRERELAADQIEMEKAESFGPASAPPGSTAPEPVNVPALPALSPELSPPAASPPAASPPALSPPLSPPNMSPPVIAPAPTVGEVNVPQAPPIAASPAPAAEPPSLKTPPPTAPEEGGDTMFYAGLVVASLVVAAVAYLLVSTFL
ncbi:MAG: serine/threonine-protein kinase [Polyangiales bacterium]